jgi:hypothetical protein
MRGRLGRLASLALIVVSAGCGSEALKSGTRDAGVPARDAGAPVRDAGAPVRDAAPDLVTVGGPVTGTFVAPGVSATIAFPNGAGFLEETFEPAPYRFYLNSGDVGATTRVTFDGPPGIVNTGFSVSLQIGAPLVREWPSAAGCGQIALNAFFQPDFDASCGAPTDAGVCPPGCSPEILIASGGSDVVGCNVTIPNIWYQTFTSAQCSLGSQPDQGDWTLTLTSVASNFVVDGVLSSPGLYLVHGTLTAQLVGGPNTGDAGLDTGTLRLDF